MLLPTIYFLRHGLTFAGKDKQTAGTMETELTPAGFEQGRSSGNFLRPFKIKKIYASPQSRVRQTIKAMSLDWPVEYDDRLREMHYGSFEGKSWEFCQRGGLTFMNLFRNPQLSLGGCERYCDAEARMILFANEKLEGTQDPIGIVGHGGSGRVLLATLLPHLKEEIAALPIGNADVIKISDGTFKIIFETPKPEIDIK
jgi:probable phosphoglycerate mutase